MLNFYGDYGVVLFRKHLHTYSKLGFTGASAFRNKINQIVDPNRARDEIKRFFYQGLDNV
jgi:tRNA-dihydrouridine synthase B